MMPVSDRQPEWVEFLDAADSSDDEITEASSISGAEDDWLMNSDGEDDDLSVKMDELNLDDLPFVEDMGSVSRRRRRGDVYSDEADSLKLTRRRVPLLNEEQSQPKRDYSLPLKGMEINCKDCEVPLGVSLRDVLPYTLPTSHRQMLLGSPSQSKDILDDIEEALNIVLSDPTPNTVRNSAA